MFRASFDDVFASSAIPMVVLDREHRMVEVTTSFCEMIDQSRQDLVGSKILDFFPESDERKSVFAAVYDGGLSGETKVLERAPYCVVPPGGGEPETRYWTISAAPLAGEGGGAPYALVAIQEVTEQVIADQLRRAVTDELAHRIGNLMSLVTAIANQTARTSDDLESFLPRFVGRVSALTQANMLLTGSQWAGTTVASLLQEAQRGQVEPGDPRVAFSGPEIFLNSQVAQAFSLALHELTTNATKHGALTLDGGHIDVRWHGADRLERFEWTESGVNSVRPPPRKGFGTTILEQIIPAQLGGSASLDFRPDGIHYLMQRHA